MSRGKGLQPIPLPVLLDLAKPANSVWAQTLGFEKMLKQDWQALASQEEADDVIKQFVETNTVVSEGKVPVEVTPKLVNEVLGLHDKGPTEPSRTFPLEAEIKPRGSMHQTKDVQNEDRRAQVQFYLQNIMHMAKSEDMSTKNYNKLKAAEEGEEINWAAVYVENLQKRVAIVNKRGGGNHCACAPQSSCSSGAKGPRGRETAKEEGEGTNQSYRTSEASGEKEDRGRRAR